MRKAAALILLFIVTAIVVFSCKKYKDPVGYDPGLTNPYCNDPNAVNYNWGFPGRADDSICFYPSDLFRGYYTYQDTILQADGTFAKIVSDTFNIYALSETKIALVGLCSLTDTLRLTATPSYYAVIDSIVVNGQYLCNPVDTIYGNLTKDQTDSTLVHVSFSVAADTGITNHYGTAVKH